ncbi:MAG TPA: hypothetical protein VIF37_19850 [Methylobacter sp.]|jgi:hypothetical protein
MITEKTTLLDRLTNLIGDLRPLPGASPKTLEQARIAVARAAAAGQQESVARATPVKPAIDPHAISAEHRAGIEAAVDSVIEQPAATPEFLVARREVPLAVTGVPNITPDWAAGRAIDSTIGPFADAVGRPVWIDLFQIVVQTRLVRSPGAAPFLTLPLPVLTISGNHFKLPAGSVWIASQQIAPGAPLGSYTGLRIKGGTMTFSHTLTASGNEIVVPTAVTCTLALKLDPGTAASGSGPGEDARLAAAEVPKTVTFIFSATGAKITSIDKARLSVYGTTVKLEPTTEPPVYVADAGRIFVPVKTNETFFTVVDVRSEQFLPAGRANISDTAWTLPVAVVSPASLGNAAGAGGLALRLADGLTLIWKGQPAPAPAGPVTLIVDTGLITLIALTVRSLGAHETIPLWSKEPGKPPSSHIDVCWEPQFPLHFFSGATGAELLLVVGSIKGNFDRPVTVAGKQVFIRSKKALIFFIESPLLTGVVIEAFLDQPPPSNRALAFAIANSLFRTTPAATLLLVAAYDGEQSPRGGAVIGFGLQYLLPILPDPYAGNITPPFERLRDVGTSGALNALVLWMPTKPPILTYTLPATSLASTIANAGAFVRTEDVALISSGAAQTGAFIMLDLSTNVDQFGVGWLPARLHDTAASSQSALAVDSMYLVSPSRSVYVLTVPAVQWEPVFTETQLPPPSPPFPTPVTFVDSGGPTAIAVQSVELVRVAPAPALDFLVDNFTVSATPQPALARLTLPFGIEAFSTLSKPGAVAARGATVDYNRPQFTSEAVKGGYQISVRAVDPAAPDSPGLQGWTIQRTDNLLVSGVPMLGRSVLDTDVDTIFNTYLGPDSPTAQVPMTRIDLSGYGESLFSHWVNPSEDAVVVSQAHFDVLIGRTSMEVVQVRSILYPYGARVVRTITIQRKNSGSVVRSDSGWQKVTNGEYLFPGTGLTTHPGVVQKIQNITNIRDTGQTIDLAGGAVVAGVVFDGDLVIENAVKGTTPAGVPARSQIGYVQIKPTGGTILTATQYEELIQRAGPLGGTVDCVLNVGLSGQLMKLGRVGVGVTQGLGGPEFVMTAWGSPQFPQGGQWSFLRQTGAGTAPEVVDKDLGVPLIRAGAELAPPPLTSPYRFADPGDLSTPVTPASDYGIIHATGTQRVFFPRPKIEAGSNQITSTRPPILADPYSLANSVGYFPRIDAAIPFPDANYAIVISGGNYRLQLPAPSFPVTVGQRTLAETGSVRSYVDYTGSTVTVVIDTSAPVPWTFQLKNIAAAMSSGSMGELMRIVGDLNADAKNSANLANSNVIFGGALGVVQDVMKFLQQLGFPAPMSISMTNSPELKITLKIPMDEELNKLMPPCGPHFEDTDVTVGYVIDLKDGEVSAEFEAGAAIFIPTPFCTCVPQPPPDPPEISGLQGVGLLKFDAKISTKDGQIMTLTVGAGIGISFKLADSFKVVAYYAETEFLIFGDVFGLGVGALMKGSIDLEIISVDISVEGKMAVLKVDASATCSDVTVWGVAQVTFAVEVTIAWVIDIDFEVQTEWSRNLNGGPCELPDAL